MPELPPSATTRFFGALRPAVKPLGYGLAITTGALAIGYAGSRVARSIGTAVNPPAQAGTVDTDPSRPGPESAYVFDPRSGRTITYGAPPSDKGTPDRNNDRDNQRLLIAGVVAAAAVAAVLIARS